MNYMKNETLDAGLYCTLNNDFDEQLRLNDELLEDILRLSVYNQLTTDSVFEFIMGGLNDQIRDEIYKK